MAEHYFGATDTGRLRDNNEDAFIAREVMDGRYIAGCVIDGVGGYEGGEIAAALTRETIERILSYPFDDAEGTLRSAVGFSNEKIFEEKEHNPATQNMACVLTLALADLTNNRFYYAHIGDTRLYLFRDHSLVKVTKDHSFVGFLEDSGKLTEEAAMRHPKRNEINKALGFDPHFQLKPDALETGSSPFLPGDLLLLCSDGLTDMINNDTMVSILSREISLREKTELLISAANDAGGKDNITVVLVQHNRQRQKHEAKKPVERKPAVPPVPEPAPAVTPPVVRTVPAKPPAPPARKEEAEEHTPPKKRRNLFYISFGIGVVLIAVLIWIFASGDDSGPAEEKRDSTAPPSRQLVNDSVHYIPGAVLPQTGTDTMKTHTDSLTNNQTR